MRDQQQPPDGGPGGGPSGAAGVPAAAHGSLRGIAAMIAATALFTSGDALMKLLGSAMPTGQLVTLRSLLSVLLMATAAAIAGELVNLRRAMVPGMGLRSAGDVGGAIFFQAALARMPFADIMGILQTTPLSLTAASAVFLGEKVGWRRWTAIAIGFTGALLVIKPGTSAFTWWSVLAVLAVLCGTLRDVSTRRLDPRLSPLVILLVSQIAVGVAALALGLLETWQQPTWGELGSLALAAVLSISGHFCVITSVRSGEISAVAPFRYAGIVWAILLGLAIWGQLPDASSLAGIAILVSAGLYTFFREQKLKRLQTGG